jgi:uncharacterized protein YlxP (DUF503 family)
VTSRNCKKEICPFRSNVSNARRLNTRFSHSLSRLFNDDVQLYDIEVISFVVNSQDAKRDDRNLFQSIAEFVKRY